MDVILTYDDGSVSTGMTTLRNVFEAVAIGSVDVREAFDRLYVNDSGLLVEVEAHLMERPQHDEEDYLHYRVGLYKKDRCHEARMSGRNLVPGEDLDLLEPMMSFTYRVDGRA